MKIYFTADCHFDHANIIKYCNRPFNSIDHMNWELVKRWNSKVSPDDLIYHLGDFAYKGQRSATYWEKQLNGHIVHLKGNHDKNNGIKTYINHAIMEFGDLLIYLTHVPPSTSDDIKYRRKKDIIVDEKILPIVDLILCGHVHNKWKWKIVEGKYCINVGMDVWNFEPITIHSILRLIGKLKHGEIYEK